jgi:hypothetical protein
MPELAAMAKRPNSIAPQGRWFNLRRGIFPFYFQGYANPQGRVLLGVGLHEDNPEATPDLLVAGLFQR